MTTTQQVSVTCCYFCWFHLLNYEMEAYKYHAVKPTRQTRTRPPPVLSCVNVAPGKPVREKKNKTLLHYHCRWGHGGREPLAVGENISEDLLRFLTHSAPFFHNRKWWQPHQSCGTAGCLNFPVRLGHLQYGCPGVSWTRGTRIRSIKYRLHLRSENSRFWGIVYCFASTTVFGYRKTNGQLENM